MRLETRSRTIVTRRRRRQTSCGRNDAVGEADVARGGRRASLHRANATSRCRIRARRRWIDVRGSRPGEGPASAKAEVGGAHTLPRAPSRRRRADAPRGPDPPTSEPPWGIEPQTYGLRNRCSTPELGWRPPTGGPAPYASARSSQAAAVLACAFPLCAPCAIRVAASRLSPMIECCGLTPRLVGKTDESTT